MNEKIKPMKSIVKELAELRGLVSNLLKISHQGSGADVVDALWSMAPQELINKEMARERAAQVELDRMEAGLAEHDLVSMDRVKA
ncbi:MAG: hypothetical protein ACYSVY_25615 [Planctomycetota bacterium]|jgi:hypothetical protein